MSSSPKIGLIPAILINVNTIIGAGLFVNINVLAQTVGAWGFCSYVLGSLLLLPVAMTIASLASQHPVAGGLYTYSKENLGRAAGFLSGWCYFLAKTTSAALLTHTFIKFLSARIPALGEINALILDAVVLTLLMCMHSVGISIGGRIQYLFTTLKGIPILMVLGVSAWLFDSSVYTQTAIPVNKVWESLPIVAFAFASFEVICSITHLLERAADRAKYVVMISFGIVTAVYTLFQFSIVGALGATGTATAEPVRQLLQFAFPEIPFIAPLINALVFTSILGGAYSILGSNCWNLFTLAQEKLVPGKAWLTKLNKHGVPLMSMIMQVGLALLILGVSKNQISLQNMFVLCICTSYLLSALAATRANSATTLWAQGRSILAVGSCLYLMGLSIARLTLSGLSTPFLAIFSLGIIIAAFQKIRS